MLFLSIDGSDLQAKMIRYNVREKRLKLYIVGYKFSDCELSTYGFFVRNYLFNNDRE